MIYLYFHSELSFISQRYFFPFISLLITVEKVSILKGKIFRNNPCIIQSNTYYNGVTNNPKKLREIFKGYINTFFSSLSSVYNPKVINFAIY